MRFIRFYLPPLLWMIAIFVFSNRTRVHVSDVFLIQFAFFKSLHVFEYGFLATLWYRALKNTTRLSVLPCIFLSALLSLGYALSDEWHQTWVPTREGKMRDVAIDALGIGMSMFILWKLLPQAPRRLKTWAKNWQLI